MSHKVKSNREPAETLDLELIQQAINSVLHAQTLCRDLARLTEKESMVLPHYLSVTFANLKASERSLEQLRAHLESEVRS